MGGVSGKQGKNTSSKNMAERCCNTPSLTRKNNTHARTHAHTHTHTRTHARTHAHADTHKSKKLKKVVTEFLLSTTRTPAERKEQLDKQVSLPNR